MPDLRFKEIGKVGHVFVKSSGRHAYLLLFLLDPKVLLYQPVCGRDRVLGRNAKFQNDRLAEESTVRSVMKWRDHRAVASCVPCKVSQIHCLNHGRQ